MEKKHLILPGNLIILQIKLATKELSKIFVLIFGKYVYIAS